MRDFFINALEKLIAVLIVLMAIAVVVGAVVVSMNPQQGGIVAGLVLLVVGALYVVLMGGMLYLAFGIYHNTRRTADACEQMANR